MNIKESRTFTPEINILPQSVCSTFRGVFQASHLKSFPTSVKHHAAHMPGAIPNRFSVGLKDGVRATDFYNEKHSSCDVERRQEDSGRLGPRAERKEPRTEEGKTGRVKRHCRRVQMRGRETQDWSERRATPKPSDGVKAGRGRRSLLHFKMGFNSTFLYLCMRYLAASSDRPSCTVTHLLPRCYKILFYSSKRQRFRGWSCRSTSGQCGAVEGDPHTISLGTGNRMSTF